MILPFAALDTFGDACFFLDEKGMVISANTAAQPFLDGAPAKGTHFPALFRDASALLFADRLTECSRKRAPQDFECVLHAGNELRDARVYLAPAGHPDEKERKYLVIVRDVTEVKKKEADLLRYFFVAQNTVNPLQITDLNGRMIFVNPAFERASGYSASELLGFDPKIFSSNKHPKQFWDDMWKEISAGRVWVGEVENKRKDGEPFFTQLLVSPIIANDGTVVGYFGIHRDLTEKRNLEKQLIHTQKMESIGTLAAGVAHEVGNPLASISALVQIIQRRTSDEFIGEKLELVKKQITRISKIIRDLVDFSRPSNFEMKLTDINENVRESVEIVRVGKKAKDIDFVMDLDEALTPLRLVSDQIQQVFVNILINAVDAIHEKRTALQDDTRYRLTSSTYFKDNHFVIAFEDNGTGVKPQNIGKIFEPFFTTKTEGKGTGLGLWVSYGIIRSFQGDIRVESKHGEWTRFIITLPINPNI